MISEVSRDALSDRAYELLRDRIIDGRLTPGERLQIARLADELGVSQTPVREALNRLASERLVSLAPYKGFSVTPLLDDDSLRQLFDARRVIELGALATSVHLATHDDHRQLNQFLDKLEDITLAPDLDVVAFNALDATFHRLTVSTCGNAFLLGAYDDLQAHVQISRHFHGRPITEAHLAQEEHREILAAFVARDPDRLHKAADAHITTVFERLMRAEGVA